MTEGVGGIEGWGGNIRDTMIEGFGGHMDGWGGLGLFPDKDD